MTSHEQHNYYMGQAIAAGRKSLKYPFGAVIVNARTGDILAAAANETEADPTLHAELNAIRQCARNNPDADWSDLVLYTTAEPCPMCQSAIIWAGISTVFYGTAIPTLRELGIHQINLRADDVARHAQFHPVRVTGGLLKDECDILFKEAMAMDPATGGSWSMDSMDHTELNCPHCGELIEVHLDMASAHQDCIEDCSVCCRPMVIHLDRNGGAVSARAETDAD